MLSLKMKKTLGTIRKRALPILLCLLFCLSCGTAQTAGDPASSIEPSETAPAPSEAAETSAPVADPEAAETETPQPDGTAPADPSAAPTATPVPTLAPVSDEQLDEGYLDAWFDNSVMIGDSIVDGMNRYAANERDQGRPCLGKMRIVGSSGLSLKVAVLAERKEIPGKVIFRSRYMTISQVVEATQSKRLFLMFGTRDIEWYTAEELIDVYGEIISIVKADHPDLRVYVHSLMPTIKSFALSVNQDYETNKAANEKLRAFCEENGYTYLELADLVRDEEGFLKYEYSAIDYSFHPNDLARAIWVKLLRSCARDEYYAGIWKPEDNTND